MTMWYRASQLDDAQKVFSGEGGLMTPARWNHLGRRAVYCSESISLCTLEWLSHHGLSVSGFDYYRYSIEVPDELIHSFMPDQLPEEWNRTPATNHTRDFAEQQLFLSEKYIALALPSVLVPEEFNLVMNPSHKDFPVIIKTVNTLGKHVAPLR
ncbi:MAG TPA: RES domain-containing protein [Gammaproteobacteria bacterium]|nr:RES domain-containing protein [Gammaproteobacteria bacterium]